MCQGDGLTAIGVTGNLSNDLCGDIAGGGKTVGLFNQSAGNDRAVLQHVLQIDQLTVGDRAGYIAHVMDVDHTLIVGVDDILGKDVTAADIFGYLRCEVIPHGAVDDGVLVGVLLPRGLTVMPKERQDLFVRRVPLTQLCVLHAVLTVVERQAGMIRFDQLIDHHVLDLFHMDRTVELVNPALDPADDKADLYLRQPFLGIDLFIGRINGGDNLAEVIGYFAPIALDDFHSGSSSNHGFKSGSMFLFLQSPVLCQHRPFQ